MLCKLWFQISVKPLFACESRAKVWQKSNGYYLDINFFKNKKKQKNKKIQRRYHNERDEEMRLVTEAGLDPDYIVDYIGFITRYFQYSFLLE